jgi:hypothetical protein
MKYHNNDLDLDTHVFYGGSSNPPPKDVPLDEKERHEVFRSGDYLFLRLPPDEEFVRREGWDMRHCLAVCQVDYCRRIRQGEIEVYSMTHIPTNRPVVDIEVALTRSSYGGPVPHPTVSQIRGEANQCPPDDDYLPHLVAFFSSFGSGWKIESHGVRNFDSRYDGDVVMRRWAHLESQMKKTGAQDGADHM